MLKRKTLLALSISAIFMLGSFQTTSIVNANSLSELKEKQENIESEREAVDSKIDQKSSEINQNIAEQKKIKDEIVKLDSKIIDTNTKMQEKEKEIQDTQAEIEKLKEEITLLEKKIAERNDLLEERARSIQTTGGSASYLDVLLGAESFSDFINRITAVNTIVNADKKIMDEQQEDKADLEDAKNEIEEQLKSLEEAKQKLESLKAELDGQKSEKNVLFAELEEQQNKLELEKEELEAHAGELDELEAQIGNEIKAEQSRLAELARQKELERQRQNAANGLPAVSSGTWTTPAYGTVTTEFGWDVLNGKPRYHYGMDIAARGSIPIVAAADGYVLKSHYSSSYGNVIYMTHSINGKTFTTVYAHLSSSSVGTGQYVEKGQKIGMMGNTGYSFGQHLHFELHAGPWTSSKSNAINPRQYVSF